MPFDFLVRLVRLQAKVDERVVHPPRLAEEPLIAGLVLPPDDVHFVIAEDAIGGAICHELGDAAHDGGAVGPTIHQIPQEDEGPGRPALVRVAVQAA